MSLKIFKVFENLNVCHPQKTTNKSSKSCSTVDKLTLEPTMLADRIFGHFEDRGVICQGLIQRTQNLKFKPQH